jgi:hypothetical protein
MSRVLAHGQLVRGLCCVVLCCVVRGADQAAHASLQWWSCHFLVHASAADIDGMQRTCLKISYSSPMAMAGI